MASIHTLPMLTSLLLLLLPFAAGASVCVIGGGIGGATVTHFLENYGGIDDIHVFERHATLGGRMATVELAGDTFEAGASVIHPKNLHAKHFAELLHLSATPESSDSSSWFGIWDGSQFAFQSLPPPPSSSSAIYRKIYSFLDSLLLFKRYGFSLLRMNRFVESMVDRFLKFYEGVESRPVFKTVEEMLKWSGLYGLTQRTLEEELLDAGLSPLLISELVTVISRINYGQSVSISGLAGAVSLAGSDSGLWAVNGGNWQLAAGIITHSNATLHLNEEISLVSYSNGIYELNSTSGNSYLCDVTVIATPLDEVDISFNPPVSIPSRKMQHTYTTFVRGLLNPRFFGLKSASEIPDLVGTVENPEIPFSSISVLKDYSKDDKAYKIFSRKPAGDDFLDRIFSIRKETIRINWPAYPHFEAPEVFAPIVLDGLQLYYVNSFENAASTIEVSAVAAENVARLIISRLSSSPSSAPTIKIIPTSSDDFLHVDL